MTVMPSVSVDPAVPNRLLPRAEILADNERLAKKDPVNTPAYGSGGRNPLSTPPCRRLVSATAERRRLSLCDYP